MINILNAITEQIAAKFKNPIYIDNLPQDFVRPSFYVELLNSVDTDLTVGLQERQIAFQITYFGKKDEFQNVSTMELYAVWNVLEKLFYRSLYVSENDYRKIDSIEHFVKDGTMITILRLDFSYGIKQDNPLTPEEVYDLIREINMKYNNRLDIIN